jgi:transposase
MKRRYYAPDFRAEVVREVTVRGRPAREVSRSLGVPRSTLQQWLAEAEADPGRPATRTDKDDHAELLELRRRVRVLEQERDILKKAAAFFAQESERTR